MARNGDYGLRLLEQLPHNSRSSRLFSLLIYTFYQLILKNTRVSTTNLHFSQYIFIPPVKLINLFIEIENKFAQSI